MTWQAAINEALQQAREHPDRRYYVFGYWHSWSGRRMRLYECRYAGPVTR